MKLHPLLSLSGVIVSVLASPYESAAPHDLPSLCSYPQVPTATVHFGDGVPNSMDIQPAPIPENRRQLRRQAPDSLGWNDPSTSVFAIVTLISTVLFCRKPITDRDCDRRMLCDVCSVA